MPGKGKPFEKGAAPTAHLTSEHQRKANQAQRASQALTRSLYEQVEADAREIAKGIVQRAKEGDVNAFKAIADRVIGPVTQRMEVDDLSGLTNEQLIARIAAASGRGVPEGSDDPDGDAGEADRA